ncbi:MAG: hypothetical protein QQN55_07710 [Nitrosopumilus sp.]
MNAQIQSAKKEKIIQTLWMVAITLNVTVQNFKRSIYKMAREKFQHSFARKRLADNGLKFYHNGKRILTPINSNFSDTDNRWDYGEMISEITKGVSFMPELKNKSRLMKSYEELLYKTGLMISTRTPTSQRFSNQKVEYYLCMQNDLKKDFGSIPRGHKVEVNFSNRNARIVGGNSVPRWIVFQKKPPAGLGYYARDTFYGYQPSSDELVGEMFNVDAQPQEDVKIKITEIICGTSLEDGRIVTMPELNFNPIIGILGIRRSGKTIFETRLVSNYYHKQNKKCIYMGDPLREMDTHCLEWNKPFFINRLALIGEKTRADPLVFLHPQTNTLQNIMCEDEVGFRITLPFKELIQDYENVLKGKETWEFKHTVVYFRNLLYDDDGNIKKDGLISCKNIRDIKNLVEKEIPPKLTGVKDKIVNVMQDILNSKILDLSSNINAKWNVEFPNKEKKFYYPWTSCLLADIIPVIVTSDIRKHFFYPQYMKFIMDDIFKNQTENKLFQMNESEIFMIFPELTSIIDSKNPTVANDTFNQIVRESGPARIGVIYDTQDIDLVPKFVKKQTTYVFAFNQDAEGAATLVTDFAALDTFKTDLLRLKTFECIAFSKTAPFHLYDEDGVMEVIENQPIPMLTFPSLSAHKPPKKMGKSVAD